MVRNALSLALSLSLLAFTGGAFGQTRLYCCTDANGQRVCGDTLPQACYERAYKEMTPGGRVVREVELLTPAQRAQRDAALKAQRERAAREAEARRRDQVLLETYASVSEIERRRDREISNVDVDLKRARAREADLLATQARLEKLKPASGKITKDLADDLATVASELSATRSVSDSKQKEIDLIRSRFEADRQRYLDLTQPDAAGGAQNR